MDDTIGLCADMRIGAAKRNADSLIFRIRRNLRLAAVPLVALSLGACSTSSEPVAGPLSGEFEGNDATAVLQNINALALKCWIKSGDKAFKGFALVPELDTRSGSPRILVVKKGKAQGLPQMVIQASGNPVKLQTFGPLAQSKLSGRINTDLIGWNTGRKSCSARA